MRKIKFRLWDNKKMQDSFELDNEFDCISGFIGDGELMQFTGLLDKNGKEIFENDIVKVSNDSFMEIGKIIFSEDSGRFGWLSSDGYFYGLQTNDECNEVIGNIHEHKHLLK